MRILNYKVIAIILIFMVTIGVDIKADIKRLDGTPIRFDTTNTNDVVRISDTGLGIMADAAQALHVSGNTIYTGNVLSNQHIVSSELSSSPATPMSGNGILYVKNDGKLYFKNDAGTESDLTSGGGSGAFTVVSGNAVYTAGDVGINDSTPSYKLDVNGTFRVTGAAIFGSTVSTGALTATTADTGQGANELYDMNQDVLTTSGVTFLTVDTGQGANELYNMNQNVQTSNAVTFLSVDTGQGANELFDMNQNMLTSSTVTFAGITGSGILSVDDTTDSSSTTTGSIHTDGGLGVALKMIVGTGATFNEDGANSDTRIEGDTEQNLFFVDASADSIGIKTNSPDNFLDIEDGSRSGTHASGLALYVTAGLGAYSSGVEFRHSNGTQGIGIGYRGMYATGSTANQKFVIQAKGTGTVVVNEASSSQDFRVESNTHGNMLLVDASADFVGIKQPSPAYTLDVNGTLRSTGAASFDNTLAMGVQSVSSNTTLGNYSMTLVDTSSDNITITLPAASTETGRIYTVKKKEDSNSVTVSGNIDGALSYNLDAGTSGSVTVVSNGSVWFVIDAIGAPSGATYATGGTVTESGGYRIHKFTSSGTLTVTTGGNCEVLVVAGGGGGGNRNGNNAGAGGGGAGGLVYNGNYTLSAGSHTVTIGAGGQGGQSGADNFGADGGNSVFGTITAIGGGGGDRYGNYSSVGRDGGSGGGAGRDDGGASAGGSGTAGQGYAGGAYNSGGGGGGGAGGVGQDGQGGNNGGDGGPGLQYDISGTATWYAGGGGGAGATTGGTGGSGVGGSADKDGGQGAYANGSSAAAANTGSGGGGDANEPHGGDGADGIIIIRYEL